MKPVFIFAFLFFFICLFFTPAVFAAPEAAQPLAVEIEQLGAEALCDLTDGDYYTFYRSDKPELTVIPEKAASSLYIVWNQPAAKYTVFADEYETVVSDGFMHKLITFPKPSEKIGIHCDGSGEICDIYLFSDGENLPEYVQNWQEPCKRADMLVFSAHADDELLMFGGTLPYYANELDLRVQVVYMTTHWQEQPRPHEMLDGLWTAGVENYPVLGIIPDIPYQPIFTLSEAAELYDFEEVARWFTEQIRRFRPSVIVTHDLKGEYGHAAHKLAAKIASETAETAGDPEVYPESAEKYGVWDVPKIYLHFYPENTIEMNWETPLESYGGITAREAAALCYNKHKSQHIWGYSVNYGENWDCRRFGLYRSLVGEDTKADFMDNIIPLPPIEDEMPETPITAEITAEAEPEETIAEGELTQVAPKTEAAKETAEMTTRRPKQTAAQNEKNVPKDFGIVILTAVTVIAFVMFIIILSAKGKKRKKQRKKTGK